MTRVEFIVETLYIRTRYRIKNVTRETNRGTSSSGRDTIGFILRDDGNDYRERFLRNRRIKNH